MPLLFVSHKYSDRRIAEVLARFIEERSAARIRVLCHRVPTFKGRAQVPVADVRPQPLRIIVSARHQAVAGHFLESWPIRNVTTPTMIGQPRRAEIHDAIPLSV